MKKIAIESTEENVDKILDYLVNLGGKDDGFFSDKTNMLLSYWYYIDCDGYIDRSIVKPDGYSEIQL